jgi:hypothetical protein
MREYALKLKRDGELPKWRTDLTLPEALILVSQGIEAEERKPEPRYLTATVYRDAMAVTLSRYFPPRMRKKAIRREHLTEL